MPLSVLPRRAARIKELASIINAGEVIACPTETAYGLLAAADDKQAVARVIKMKGREPGKPIALVAADKMMVVKYFRLTRPERRLVDKFWPGPITLLLKPKRRFSPHITGQSGLVGVRIPASVWLRRLISAVGVPLTATSANRAGDKTSYTGAAVKKTLASRGLKFLVDAGRLPKRPTSTVIRLVNGRIVCLRTGAVPVDKLQRVLS